MASIYIQENSPFYWLRFYDKFEPVASKRRKSVNTKIEVTKADLERYRDWKNSGAILKDKPLIRGNNQTKQLLERFNSGLAERNLQINSGVKLKKRMKLSEGLLQYIEIHTVPGSDEYLQPKTILNYKNAVKHFISAVDDKNIFEYTKEDYRNLLRYFEAFRQERKIRVDAKITKLEQKPLSINTRSFYTRALNSLWNYFVKEELAPENIITKIDSEEDDPDPIPSDDMYTIIKHFEANKDYPHHFQIIYFMLLTGCRPSSAIVQLKENIDFRNKVIRINNVKAGKRKRKKKEFYKFPLYSELEKLLISMGIKEGDTGRLFPQFAIHEMSYTNSLKFWDRAIKKLLKDKKIRKRYILKQIRPTLASFLINILKVDIYTVKNLLDHADIKITDKHYIDFQVAETRKELNDLTIELFKTSKN